MAGGRGGRGIGGELPQALRAHLVRRREALGMSQTELAEAMGTSQSAISDLETGATRDPGINTVHRWVTALELTMEIVVKERSELTVRFD